MRRFIAVLLLSVGLVPVAYAKVVGQALDYSYDGTTLKGYIAYDDSIEGKRPGVLVVHEWWGHNDYARKRADQLARMGYVALAVDMYGDGKLAEHPDDAKKFYSEVMGNMPLAKARFMAAMDALNSHKLMDHEKGAAIGYCFGGAVVLQMAREGVALDGVVSFHGSLGTSAPASVGAVKAKILVAHGAADPLVPGEQIIGFMDEMNKAGADYQFVAYGGATHSFTNPGADAVAARFNLPLAYSAQADKASWADMTRLFDEIFD